jgi:hypothetical protein
MQRWAKGNFQCYNAQTVVATESLLIVAHDVVQAAIYKQQHLDHCFHETTSSAASRINNQKRQSDGLLGYARYDSVPGPRMD